MAVFLRTCRTPVPGGCRPGWQRWLIGWPSVAGLAGWLIWHTAALACLRQVGGPARPILGQTCRQTDRKTDGQTDRQTDGRRGGRTDRPTYLLSVLDCPAQHTLDAISGSGTTSNLCIAFICPSYDIRPLQHALREGPFFHLAYES